MIIFVIRTYIIIDFYQKFMIFCHFIAYFVKEANPHHDRMEQVIKELCEDVDTDVRAFLQIPQMYDSDGEPINDVSVSILIRYRRALVAYEIIKGNTIPFGCPTLK